MGYRSEVAIGLSDPGARLLIALANHDTELFDLIKHADNNGLKISRLKDDGPPQTKMNFEPDQDYGCTLYWGSLKWYDGYPDIDAMNTFLASIPAEDYRFVRIGEETEDLEEHGQYYESDIHIHRTISW